jgi:hypothetical protein
MKIMPGHSKNAHKLGLVPIMNRAFVINKNIDDIRRSMGTPQFSNWDPYYPYRTLMNNLQDEMRRNYGVVFDDYVKIRGPLLETTDRQLDLFCEAYKQLNFHKYYDGFCRYFQNKKNSEPYWVRDINSRF